MHPQAFPFNGATVNQEGGRRSSSVGAVTPESGYSPHRHLQHYDYGYGGNGNRGDDRRRDATPRQPSSSNRPSSRDFGAATAGVYQPAGRFFAEVQDEALINGMLHARLSHVDLSSGLWKSVKEFSPIAFAAVDETDIWKRANELFMNPSLVQNEVLMQTFCNHFAVEIAEAAKARARGDY